MFGFGLRIIENVHMIDEKQKRTHRKKRINKKWAKRYGFIHTPKKDVFIKGDMIIGHPATIKELRKTIERN